MKKLIYSIIGLVMFASCEEDYKTDITIPMSGIYLNSPAEGVIMDLNDESKDSYEFTWDKASEHGSVLIFSTTKDGRYIGTFIYSMRRQQFRRNRKIH